MNLTRKKSRSRSKSQTKDKNREKPKNIFPNKQPIKPMNIEDIFENSWMAPMEEKRRGHSLKLMSYQEIDHIQKVQNFAVKRQYIKRSSSHIQSKSLICGLSRSCLEFFYIWKGLFVVFLKSSNFFLNKRINQSNHIH